MEERPVLELLSRAQAEREECLARAGAPLGAYFDALLADSANATVGKPKAVFSTDVLLEWYSNRAREIDARTGRVSAKRTNGERKRERERKRE